MSYARATRSAYCERYSRHNCDQKGKGQEPESKAPIPAVADEHQSTDEDKRQNWRQHKRHKDELDDDRRTVGGRSIAGVADLSLAIGQRFV